MCIGPLSVVHGTVRTVIGALDSWRPLENPGEFTGRAKCALCDIRGPSIPGVLWKTSGNFMPRPLAPGPVRKIPSCEKY